MVKSRRYITVVETQSTPLVVDGEVIIKSYPLRYVGGIMHETEEGAWHSHDNVEGVKVVQVIPVDFTWDDEGIKFNPTGADILTKGEK